MPASWAWTAPDAASFAEVFQQVVDAIRRGAFEKTVPVVAERGELVQKRIDRHARDGQKVNLKVVWDPANALVAGEVMAVAYSGFREGQHPDRGDGAVNPSAAEILEITNWLDVNCPFGARPDPRAGAVAAPLPDDTPVDTYVVDREYWDTFNH